MSKQMFNIYSLSHATIRSAPNPFASMRWPCLFTRYSALRTQHCLCGVVSTIAPTAPLSSRALSLAHHWMDFNHLWRNLTRPPQSPQVRGRRIFAFRFRRFRRRSPQSWAKFSKRVFLKLKKFRKFTPLLFSTLSTYST